MHRHARRATMAAALALAAGCATAPPDWATVAARAPAPVVTARGETMPVGTGQADAADDPAIWRNPNKPAASLIVGTDKKAGLYVYDLAGRQRDFADAGRVNNVDLIEAEIGAAPAILVVASDRGDPAAARLALFRLDPTAAKLIPLGRVEAGAGEAYGLCLAAGPAGVEAFLVVKDGTIRQFALALAAGPPTARLLRTLKLASQSEGCVVDPVRRHLYVAEEDVGLWRFDARAEGATAPVQVAAVDGRRLVADVEGVALGLGPDGRGHLLVSSQGDNGYAVYSLPDEAYLGRFRIGPGRFGAVSETDGIALAPGDFGADYPAGLFVAQDGDNAPAAQNFKLVAWADILDALAR